MDKSVQLIWHAELAHEIIPEECEMRADSREYVLKQRDPKQWNSSFLQCNSSSALKVSRSPSTLHTSLVFLNFFK